MQIISQVITKISKSNIQITQLLYVTLNACSNSAGLTLILSKTEARKNKKKSNGKYSKMTQDDREAYVQFHNDVRARVSWMASYDVRNLFF